MYDSTFGSLRPKDIVEVIVCAANVREGPERVSGSGGPQDHRDRPLRTTAISTRINGDPSCLPVPNLGCVKAAVGVLTISDNP
jgi:hypothetical protein